MFHVLSFEVRFGYRGQRIMECRDPGGSPSPRENAVLGCCGAGLRSKKPAKPGFFSNSSSEEIPFLRVSKRDHRLELKHFTDASSVPQVSVVLALATGGEGSRAENGSAFSPAMTHALIVDAP